MGLGTFNPNGLFHTSFNPDQLNQRSFSDMILRLWPMGSAPLYALTGEANRTKAKSVEHGYFTKHAAYFKPTVHGTIIPAATTAITVDDTASLVPGMVYQVPSTRENLRVISITDGTIFESERGYGRIAATDIPANSVLTPVGNSQTEAAERPVSRSVKAEYVPNYTVIIRNAWSLSNTTRASYAEAGFNNVAENRADCMNFHSEDIEQQILWGQAVSPKADGTTGNYIHATQGLVDAIYQYAPNNIQTANATTNFSELVDLVENPFFYSSDPTKGGMKQRMGFCDAQALKVLTDIGTNFGQVQMTQKETSFGMMFQEFRFYKGIIRLVEHPLLTELAPVPGIMIIADLTSWALAYMDGRDVKVEEYDGSKNSVSNGKDATGGSMLSELATEFRSPQTCGIVNGLTAAGA